MGLGGRPSELDNELKIRIKQEFEEKGEKPTLLGVSKMLDISYDTIKSWARVNYKGFSEFMDGLRRDWKLQKAQENIDEFLQMNDFDDPKLKKLKVDVSLFVAETLGKKHYSKRNELTGADGGLATIQIVRSESNLPEDTTYKQ